MNNIWESIVEKGRLSQWLICGGGMILNITGGIMGFLDSDDIVKIVLALITSAYIIGKVAPE